MNKLKVEFDGIYWAVKNKYELCQKLDIDLIIEDNPNNIENFINKEIKVLYFKETKSRDLCGKKYYHC